MKEFIEQLNDMTAPVTRAWENPEIVALQVSGPDIHENEAEFVVIVKVTRRHTKFAPVV